jgi:hypothetical protein
MTGFLTSHPELLVGLGGIAALLAFGFIRDSLDRRWMQGGDVTANRLRLYTRTILIQLTLAMLCIVSWQLAGQNMASLGFRFPEGWRAGLTVGITMLALGQLLYTLHRVATSPDAREKIRRQISAAGKLDLIRPENDLEHRRFRWVAVNAGITEEITFRGFLIGALAMAVPLWAAATIATILFILAHAYQGAAGLLRVIPFAVLLTIVFLVGGSLWPVMLLHVAADLVGAEVFRLAGR